MEWRLCYSTYQEHKVMRKMAQRQQFSWTRADAVMLATVMVYLALGLLWQFSASYPYALARGLSEYHYVVRQSAYTIVGVLLMIMVATCSYELLRRFSVIFLVGIIFALCLTLTRFGYSIGGAKRWIAVGPLTFQASEWAKIALVLYGAGFLSRNVRKVRHNIAVTLHLLGVTAILAVLVLLQPHFSGAVLLGIIGAVMCFLGGARKRHLAVIAICVALMAPLIGKYTLREYQRKRWAEFWDRKVDVLREDYQRWHAQLALRAGGITGRGLCQSREKQLYLPAAHTDFIFPTIGEECGLLATLGILLFYGLMAWYGFGIACNTRDQFGALLAAGVTSLILIQAVLNIGVALGILPTTGVPLPFLSIGGNALVCTLIGMGLLFNVSRNRHVILEAMGSANRNSQSRRRRGRHRRSYIPRHRVGTGVAETASRSTHAFYRHTARA
ncbi:MAG TPA: cell division protein FtsW [Armatimonadetes bacterium]|nr:cell division protein FtsW [Armatimonadota bacterium]